MKCRWFPGFSEHANHIFGDESAIVENEGVGVRSLNVVKFEVQVFTFCFNNG